MSEPVSERGEHEARSREPGQAVSVPRNAVLLKPVANPPRAQDVIVLEEAFELGAALSQGVAVGKLHVDDVGECGEAQLPEFVLEGLDAQRAREGHKHVKRLRGNLALLVHRHVLEGAHVVQPVGQLDHDDAPVLGHREEHGARVHALVELLVASRVHFAHFGVSLHNACHLVAKTRADVVDGHVLAVLHGVVEEARDDRCCVHAEAGEDERHLNGVGHEGLTALACLPVMCRHSESERISNLPDVRLEVGRGSCEPVRVLTRIRVVHVGTHGDARVSAEGAARCSAVTSTD
mmetsp:Transcript_26213/g.70826  ORF Transcript_26213/g.70826 Transcript_26213/m.70826 type:complete len:292 (-) Transcript_26213:230-1105(-)